VVEPVETTFYKCQCYDGERKSHVIARSAATWQSFLSNTVNSAHFKAIHI